MKLQEFGALLAEEQRRTSVACDSLTRAFTELNSLRRKPRADGTTLGAETITVARSLLGSASTDLVPAWFPPAEALSARVLCDQLPVFVRVVGDVAVIADSCTSGLLVRGQFAHGMGQLFELLWARANAPIREQILRLMAAGLDDAAVAAATGRSVRTVRTHVAALMSDLGVETRLAAGVAAVRRGWL